MDAFSITAVGDGKSTESPVDRITAQELANLWASNTTLSARLTEERGKFVRADLLMVKVALETLPLEKALGATFTQQYATVAAHSEDQLLLAFALPEPVKQAKSFVGLQRGLETLYAGARHYGQAEQGYRLGTAGTAILLGKALDPSVVAYLAKLGTEAAALAKGRGAYLRSHVTLDRTTLITIPGGEAFALEQLPHDLPVYCPVHVDTEPTAVVHWYPDGTPGIQCARCQRTYAAASTHRHYDFGHFDRTVRMLADQDANQTEVTPTGLEFASGGVTYLAERYLPALEMEYGVTFVKSPKGTGKTEALADFVARCKKQHLHVLLLGHRRALLQSISARLGLECYFVHENGAAMPDIEPSVASRVLDFDDGADAPPELIQADSDTEQATRYRRVAPSQRYAICLDSMLELDPSDKDRQYDVVIVDEAEQVFAHLTGDTLKDRRRAVFEALSYYLRKASQVILLDADLNMVTMTAAFELLKPETPARFIINDPPMVQDKVYLYGTRGQLMHALLERVSAGKKVFVATNSKRKAADLGKLLGERFPDARVAVVTSDNAQQQAVQDLLGNIVAKFENDLDVLVASPTIGTGIDITFKDGNGNPRQVVDCVFGFFEANIVTHFDIDQQLMRVRHPGEVNVWVDPVGMNYETDPGCIKRELERTVRRSAYLVRYSDSGQPVFEDDHGLIEIWAQVLAAARGSKNKLAELFKALRVEGGWTPVAVDHDKAATESGNGAIAMAKELRLAERTKNLLAAEPLTSDEVQALAERDQHGLSLTDAQRHSLERYYIESFYADGEITSDLIDFDNEGRTRREIQRLEYLVCPQDWVNLEDLRDVSNYAKRDGKALVAFDCRHCLVQREVLEEVLAAAGLFNGTTRRFNTDVAVDAGTLTNFLTLIDDKGHRLESLFGLALYEDRQRKPVAQLKGILRLIGLDLTLKETEQIGDKKIRRYALDTEKLESRIEAIQWRDVKFDRATGEGKYPEADKPTRSSLNKLAGKVVQAKANKGRNELRLQ